jgi:threonine synthase
MPGTFTCCVCGSGAGDTPRQYRCTSCASPLDFTGLPATFPRAKIEKRPADMWRYAEALPCFGQRISLGEPITPLQQVELDGYTIQLKCDYCQPTGSYKDRGAALLMGYLKSIGVKEAVEDSSGNAGAAMAAYAARAGIKLKVFCPASAAAGKLAQIRLYGAELVPVPGPRPRATAALLEYTQRYDAVYASHLWHPLFIGGIKTLAYELTEQSGWQAPDIIACPVGAGSILLGLYWGFIDLLEAGVIQTMPRLVAVQSAKVNPVLRAFKTNATSIESVTPQKTLAEGIALPAPVRGAQVLEALRQSNGAVIAVSEEEIVDGVTALGSRGFCVEPTSAVVWHGLKQFLASADLAPTAKVIALLSGHGLKATDWLSKEAPISTN